MSYADKLSWQHTPAGSRPTSNTKIMSVLGFSIFHAAPTIYLKKLHMRQAHLQSQDRPYTTKLHSLTSHPFYPAKALFLLL